MPEQNFHYDAQPLFFYVRFYLNKSYQLIKFIKQQGEMSLRNGYEFLQDYCGTLIMKTSSIQFKDGVMEQVKGETSSNALQAGQGFSGAANGRLYTTTYIKHCLCGSPMMFPCCIRHTYEIEGYGTKLAETTIPHGFCTCNPEYPVFDGQEKALGTMKLNCLGLIIPCCLRLELTTFNRPQTYIIPRPCCRLFPCCKSWEAKDATGNNVAEISFEGGPFMCKKHWHVNFLGNLSNQDKLLFLSSIPFLP